MQIFVSFVHVIIILPLDLCFPHKLLSFVQMIIIIPLHLCC